MVKQCYMLQMQKTIELQTFVTTQMENLQVLSPSVMDKGKGAEPIRLPPLILTIFFC